MILLISGSRNITDYEILRRAVFEFLKTIYLDEIPLPLNKHIDKIVHGNAKGIDTLADRFADDQKISKVIFPANWAKYGKKAGIFRNETMAKYANRCICIWDGKSKGTRNMIELCEKYSLPCYIHKTK